jgi:hypothetical protein
MKSWDDIREHWHMLPSAPQFRDVDRSCVAKRQRQEEEAYYNYYWPEACDIFFPDDLRRVLNLFLRLPHWGGMPSLSNSDLFRGGGAPGKKNISSTGFWRIVCFLLFSRWSSLFTKHDLSMSRNWGANGSMCQCSRISSQDFISSWRLPLSLRSWCSLIWVVRFAKISKHSLCSKNLAKKLSNRLRVPCCWRLIPACARASSSSW